MASANLMARRTRAPLLVILASMWLASCGGVESSVPGGEFVPAVVEWNLVFEDNFDGNALDASTWNVDEGDGCPDLCGWGNNELQTYSANNIEVSGGTLKLRGQQEMDGSYTSARINTQGKFDFTYGKIEVRARIPSGQGTWPAIWALHSPAGSLNPEYADVGVYGPWPLSGEIDIMEAFNYGPGNDKTKSTTHYGLPIQPFDGTGGLAEKNGVSLTPNADTQFLTYGMEWERGRIRFFVDQDSLVDRGGQLTSNGHFQSQIIDEYYAYYPAGSTGFYDPLGIYRTALSDAPFDQAFHLLLNFAIGGNPVGDPDGNTIFPQALEIDYVRVYECANSNPDTRRGCGTLDPTTPTLDDHDGGPLENVITAKPYIELLDLFLDGPETIVVDFGTDVATNALQVGEFVSDGASLINNTAATDPDDAVNTVWQVAVSGGLANVSLSSEDLSADPILDTGFDLSSSTIPDPVGEVAFDMYINSIDASTDLIVKMQSEFPNLGEFTLPQSMLAPAGEWKTYSVKFADILANPGFTFDPFFGTGVDLERVLTPFVFELANGSADVLLDNIRVTNACYVVGECTASAITRGIPDLVVFDDAINTATWDRGIVASDSGSGFTDYTIPDDPNNKVNWAIIDDPDDPSRGQVIDVTFNDSGEFGVWFVGVSGGIDVSAYSAGAVVFDIIVDDYGTNTTGMTMKVDCFFPCTSGDKNLGVIADGVWETVTVPVASLTGSGLDLSVVNTGVVIFPTSPQNGGISFRLDNIRWEAETTAPPPAQIDLPVTFDDPGVDYSLIDFAGTGTGLVADPTNSANMVASTTKGPGAEVFAGTVIGTDAGFATPIPFAAGDTTMSARVYSPAAGIPILLRVENADNTVGAEVIATSTLANQWETLTWDFSTVGIDTNATFIKAVIFFDFGQIGADTTFLWDDVAFGASGPMLSQVDLPVTFDDNGVNYDLIDFGDPVSAMTALDSDPDNMSNTVASTTKPLGAPLWAGTTVGGTNGLASAIPLTATDTMMTVRVYSPDANIPVRLKVENKNDPTVGVETEALTTAANTWETLTFDFANEVPGTATLNPASTYDKASIFFNFGTDGDTAGEKTYLWDDMEFVSSVATVPFRVYDDAADAVWDVGIAGTESPNFATTTDGTLGPVTTWSEVAATDPTRGQVIQSTIGGVAGEFGLMFIQSSAGIDLSAYANGSVVFDILVSDYDTNTNGMIMKIDCIFPCTSGDTAIGVVGDGRWETVVVPVAQLVGTGLDLATVNTGVVIFPDVADQQAGAAVTFQIDNVRWEPDVPVNQAVFDDTVDATWDVGIAGTESPNFATTTDGTLGPVTTWSVVPAADMSRGDVIQGVIGGVAGEFGLLFIQSSAGVDLSTYDEGAVVFDIFVTNYDTNTNGMIMKIDCVFPCTSGDTAIGVVGNGQWETVTVEVSQLVGTGLDLTTVNTGLVIFPDIADQQAGATVTFQIDNVHWEP